MKYWNWKMVTMVTGLFQGIFSFAQVAATAELANPLPVGSQLPAVMVQEINGNQVSTLDIFNKPTVMVVYRGGWCPYCTKQLSGLGTIEHEIMEMGYQVVAVSPDAPEQLKATLEKQKLTYRLVSDNYGNLVKAMGLAFTAPERYGDMLLKASGGANREKVLPVPAVYVFDKNQKARFVFTDPDYKKRLDEKVLLETLKNLK